MNKLLFGFLVLLCSPLIGQDLSLYQKQIYKNAEGQELPYRIVYPENYDKGKKYPLLLFLHGSGERGSDNEKQLTHGSKLFLSDENRKKYPALIVFPQCPLESSWTVVEADRNQKPAVFVFDYSKPAKTPLTSAVELVKKMIADGSVDSKKVYIGGLSMGGMGTFEAVYRNPDLFAAAMPICGGGDAASYDKRILKTPFWILHGDQDEPVNVKNSRIMVDKLKQLKADVRYTEYPGVNHNSWDNAFAEPDFMSWFFDHKRE